MKRMNSSLLTAFLAMLMLVFVSSCKDDGDDTPVVTKPTKDVNFTVSVSGNTVNFHYHPLLVLYGLTLMVLIIIPMVVLRQHLLH